MIDWSNSMEQTFEFYEVDPNTWKDKKLITNVISCSINRDSSSDTLGSASFSIDNLEGEIYIRVYLVVVQNELREKFPLGVYLLQTPSYSFDGRKKSYNIDAYTPLEELNENDVPIGTAILKNDNILNNAYNLVNEYCRAPVIKTTSDKTLNSNFVSQSTDTYLKYIIDLLNEANYHLYLDENGEILFAPNQSLDEMQPVWTFNDDNSSILMPSLSITNDLYKIPNVLEVQNKNGTEQVRIINSDTNSPVSTINRGREIIKRIIEPVGLHDNASSKDLEEYGIKKLKELSSIEYEIVFEHGYCPVRLEDCVRLNYKRAGIEGIKALIINQSLDCKTGMTIEETAKFTKNIWNFETDLSYSYNKYEYLENLDRNNYINTMVLANQDTRIDILFKTPETLSNNNESILGAGNGYQQQRYVLWNNVNSNIRFDYGSSSSNTYNINPNTIYRLVFNNGSIILYDENNNQLFSDTISSNNFNSSMLYLFRSYDDENSGTLSKIYSCKIYQKDLLVRNYVAAKKKTTNEIGLLDIVNNNFYSGTIQNGFDVGPETIF